MTKPERNYSQTDREALAIVWAVKRLSKFLLGGKFEIVTDHRALKYVFSPNKDVGSIQAARLHRWAITLSAYDYEIVHKPASELVFADYLSRNLVLGSVSDGDDTRVWFNGEDTHITKSLLYKKIINSFPFNKIKQYIVSGWPNDCKAELKKIRSSKK